MKKLIAYSFLCASTIFSSCYHDSEVELLDGNKYVTFNLNLDGVEQSSMTRAINEPGNLLVIDKFGDEVKTTIKNSLAAFGLPLDSVQGDFRFFEVLKTMGAKVSYSEHAVTVKSGTLKGIEIDMNAMPDAAMTLVPLSLYTKEEIVIKNIASWRVKETDRIEAMATQMRKLGVKVQCGDDYIALDASSTNEESPVFDTYNDHRMAMCMSLVAFNRDIVINNPEVINKTFPTYFNLLNTVIKR